MPVTSISGFPEWLPEERIVEQLFLDELRNQFELFGFQPLETRLFEPLDWLQGKGGDVDKEIYGVHRVNAEGDDGKLGLHFDLTVPLARYVVENAGRLNFPFARYQIQKVYRGERAQEGRFREFYQADVDVIGKGELPLHYDAEMLLLIDRVYRDETLKLPATKIRVNNRKITSGIYAAWGIQEPVAVLRIVDKLGKLEPGQVRDLLMKDAGLQGKVAADCVKLALIRTSGSDFVKELQGLGVQSMELNIGVDELKGLVDLAEKHLGPGRLLVDLGLARGLDYYDGNIFECHFVGDEDLGSICGGGRYSKLATAPDGTTYPGVGISFGINRMLSRLIATGRWSASRKVPTCVLVALPSEDKRQSCYEIALALRDRGIPAELAAEAAPYGKQIREAERKGIPFVWFPDTNEVKDIRSGDQVAADVATWMPTDDDLRPRIKVSDGS